MSSAMLFLTGLGLASASFPSCRKNITQSQTLWNCSDTFVLEFPKRETIPTGTDTYDLSYNRILELHVINSTCKNVHSCEGCLRRLYLHHNSIDTIDNRAFIHLHCLQTLDLSYNKVKGTSLSSMTFNGLIQLEYLTLKGNPLVKLSDFTLRFNELRILKSLDLSDCDLKTIEQHAFDDLDLLENLDLSGNQIQSVDPASLRGLHFLDVLDLSRNSVRHIQNNTFLDLIKLRKLFMNSNKIESVPDDAFAGIEDIEVLCLADNWFQQIPYNAMKGLRSLRTLNMSENYVTGLNASPWPEGIKLRLKELYLDRMKHTFTTIHYRAFTAFPVLEKVSITGNRKLSVIAHDAFEGNVQHVKEVHLQNNGLEYVAEHLLPWATLDVLDLSGNPWDCNCNLKWVLQGEYFNNHTIRCESPVKLRGENLLDLSAKDLQCPRSLVWILICFVLGFAALSIVLVTILVWRRRGKLPGWCRLPCRRVKGRYISVYTKDVEDDAEATATINTAEDELPLKDPTV